MKYKVCFISTFNMKTVLSLIASIFFCCSFIQAQTIRVNGKLINAGNQQPVEFATVVLQTTDSIFVNGASSNKNGEFSIEKISAGSFRLIITSVSFDTVQVELMNLDKAIDLGNIEMNESATQLAEVTVEGTDILNKSDRKLYFIGETQRSKASNGLNLINRMNIPRLVFNPLQNTITSVDNKNVEFRINDIPAQKDDILALHPKDIVRIEYIDNPGLKYGTEAGYVLNYIIQKRQSGGSAGVDLNHSINRNFHTPSIFAKAHKGKSEISMSYFLKTMRIGGLMRTNKETFRFENGDEWIREEIGQPSRMSEDQQNGRLAYNYTDPDKRAFNATVRYNYYAHPNNDFISQSYWEHNPSKKIDMKDINNDETKTPSIDLYYQEKLKNGQTLTFNLYYSKRLSNVGRTYTEILGSETLTDISSNVKGDRDAYIGEILYEKQFTAGKLTSGLKHQQSYTKNTYSGNVNTTTNMIQGDSYLYSEFSGKIKEKTDYTVGIGLTRVQVNQENVQQLKNYFFYPRIRMRYHINDASYLGVNSRIYNRTPSLSQLSAVCQPIDSLQKQCGNPLLKSWINSHSSIEYSYNAKTFNFNVKANYLYMHKPVMSEKTRENGLFIHTFNNQKSLQCTDMELSIGYRPFGEFLMLNATAVYAHYLSVGNRYRHTFNNFYHSETVSFNYRHLSLSLINQRGGKWFFGEEYNANETIHLFDLTYTHPKFSTGITVINPFTKTYKRDTENFSEIAPREHTWYSNKIQGLALLKFSYNFRWGEEYKSVRRKINNSDSESGIMSGGK